MSGTFYTAGKIVRQSLPLLMLLVLLEIIAGQFLNTSEKILGMSSVLMLIPVVNGVGGNIGSILGARITSGLHVGYIEPKLKDRNLRKNLLLSLVLGGSVFLIMGIIIFVITRIMHFETDISIWRLLIIFLASGAILITVLCFICVASALYTYRKGLDPDNIVTPIVTSVGDFIGITSIMVMTLLIGI
ncbi:MAG: magnesium transporter [Candidatus Thermoplasmatota archaeon]|nr:magnesium transporter [Candidatus Thermoplasmatota archaeon]MDP7266191.1 magnesium transporter [Candidatus Thermoplasmatota archaeon]